MKKVLLVLAVALCTSFAAIAQSNSLGIRVCDRLEIAYEHSIGNKNMLQLEVGFPAFSGIVATGTYNWVYPISKVDEGFLNWYVGVGLSGGMPDFDFSVGLLAVTGRFGIEYRFEKMPLKLSVDYRPSLGAMLGGGAAGFYQDVTNSTIGVGVRYCF